MAINGHGVGIGATIQLSAAIRIATADAKIGFVFSRRGVVMEGCSSYFLPRLIGFSRAMHLTTTAATYLASDPLLRGLYSEITPTPQRCLERALEIADDVAKNTSLVSYELIKSMMFRSVDTLEDHHLLESKLISAMYGSRDNVEGTRSFFEKRSPKFSATVDGDAPPAYPWWTQVDTSSKPTAIGPHAGTKSKL
jgi:enoyl-CoA hydratase/carnithine racemase